MPLAEFPPPPSELMTTNRAPTDSEVASSRVIINSAEQRVSMIQAMLDDLERQKAELLDDLERQKAKLLDLVSTHRAAISPLKSFPPELLVEVFAEWATFTDGFFRSSTPLLVSAKICSRWRRIALDAPQLWTRILEESPRSIIDSWIIRSRELPLHVRLQRYQLTSSDPALKALIPHAHRWGQVNFALGPRSNSALTPVKTRLQSLKKLRLSFINVTETVDFCEVAPQLTEIRLERMSQPIPVFIKLPWAQLRVCTVDNSGVALYILRQAEHLRTCHLDMHNARERSRPLIQMPRGPPVHHAELDTFIIYWSREDYSMRSFFSSLTLPSIRTLKVRFPPVPGVFSSGDADGTQFALIIFNFLERSSTYLDTLSLIHIPLSSSQLISCLALAPSLVSLDIEYDRRGRGINEELLNVLNANLPGSILDHLKSLSFRGRSRFSEESLDALVMSRREIDPADAHRVTLLENLTLECSPPDDWPASRLPSFHRFVPGGLNIKYGRHWGMRNPPKPPGEGRSSSESS